MNEIFKQSSWGVPKHDRSEMLARRLSRLWKILQLTEGESLIEDALVRAKVYEQDELWDLAIDAYEEALSILGPRQVNSRESISIYYADLGFRLALCLKYVGRWSEALSRQKENVAIYKEVGDLQGKANAYMEMGHIYQMMNLYEAALLYYSEAYYLYRQVAEETFAEMVRRTARHGMANAKESLGNLEFQLKVLPKGVADLEEARLLYLDLGMTSKAAIISQILEDVQVKQGGQHA